MAEHNKLGKKGEEEAVEFLKQKGFEILATNYRFGRAEIDIISKDKENMVFIEVKTRSTDYFGYPEEAVNKAKRKNMILVAEEYMYQNSFTGSVRFDIISIIENPARTKIYHIEDAFFHEEGGDTEIKI